MPTCPAGLRLVEEPRHDLAGDVTVVLVVPADPLGGRPARRVEALRVHAVHAGDLEPPRLDVIGDGAHQAEILVLVEAPDRGRKPDHRVAGVAEAEQLHPASEDRRVPGHVFAFHFSSETIFRRALGVDRPLLFSGIARIVPVDEDVGVNEGGHGCTNLPVSSPGPSVLSDTSCGPGDVSGGVSPRRKASVAPPERASAPGRRSRREPNRRPRPNGSRYRAVCRAVPRRSWESSPGACS